MARPAIDSASGDVSPPNSASNHPLPSGSSATPSGLIPIRRVDSTNTSSIPSRPIGLCAKTSGTRSAAFENVAAADCQQYTFTRTLHQAAGGF